MSFIPVVWETEPLMEEGERYILPQSGEIRRRGEQYVVSFEDLCGPRMGALVNDWHTAVRTAMEYLGDNFQ